MSEEADKRIEKAAADAQRAKDADEFLKGLTKNDTLLKNIQNPEAYVMREKMRGAANRGELQRTECTHPLDQIWQYSDDDPLLTRNKKPVNLFECGVCHMMLWFADPWGNPISDS